MISIVQSVSGFITVYCIAVATPPVYIHPDGCVYVGAELRVRPPGESFTKPVGGSVVMTCSLELEDRDTADDDVVLSWLDDSGEEVSAVTGRYVVTLVSHLLFLLVNFW